MDYDIAKRLVQFRTKYRVPVTAIANATGISKENLYKWEKGTKPSNFNDYLKLDEYIRTMEETGGPPLYERKRGRPRMPDASVDLEESLTIPNVQLVVHFTEGSMIPLYKPGCRLCLRKVPYPRSLVWGNVYYFVDLNDKGILRRVYATEDKETIRLLSYDPEQYPPIMRQYNELKAVYEVIGLLFI